MGVVKFSLFRIISTFVYKSPPYGVRLFTTQE
nr:MAG TPA: hypothetical protein [Caudoviricetes sp.]